MKEIVLLDADIIGYRVGFTTNDLPLHIAEARTDELINRIVYETNAKSYKCYLSGEENFRFSIYPKYKGNRLDKPKPVHLQSIREHLVRIHAASVVCGWEADDELAIDLTTMGDSAIVASIDKDLLQVPGWHYDFVKGLTRFITPLEGLRRFYGQVISGDGADNIPSFDGKVRSQSPVPKFVQKLIEPLYDMTEELDMFQWCCDVYADTNTSYKDLERNAKLLYLLRRENDEWLPPGQRPV
jgi:5'-3' exonuclease, N-terminal resolvase-like domain